MARPLLVPTAFVSLLGAPACTDPPAPTPQVMVATRSGGNARTPTYDDGMLYTKAGVTLVAEPVEAPEEE